MKIVAYCVNMGIDDAKLISGSIQMWYSTNRTLDHTIVSNINISQCQPIGARGTRSPSANFKMATRGTQNGRRGSERGPIQGIGPSNQQ